MNGLLRCFSGLLVAGWVVIPMSAQTPAQIMADFPQRRQLVLEQFAREGNEKFIQAQCLFALGRNQDGIRVVNQGLDALVPGNKINRWMHGGNTGFIAWPGIECYVRFQQQMDQSTRDRYRKIYTGGVFYAKLSTSNHKIMAAVSRYLATQCWGADAFQADSWFMQNDPYIQEMTAKSRHKGWVWGSRFGHEDETGEKYLREIIASSCRVGPGEYASRPYGAQNVLPLLTIADCAKDAQLAAQARVAYEISLAQIAPAWMAGHLATFAPRSYPDTECQCPWGFATLPWFYFGGLAPELRGAKAAAAAAVSRYQVPEEIVEAAVDRVRPYEYRALINGWALNHHMQGSYALFSRSAKVGGKPWGGQSYPCGVMWQEPRHECGSHLWITNPAADEAGKMGLHTHGVRPFEQELLARDALLYVFQIQDDNPFPYALGYIPGGYRVSMDEGRKHHSLFFHYGSVLIAVRASHPIEWHPDQGIRAPASPARTGDSEFRLREKRCALVIETASPTEFSAANDTAVLQRFRDRILQHPHPSLRIEAHTSATYRTRHNMTLSCTFDREDSIDGQKIDYARWPISSSPWTRQTDPKGPFIIEGKKTIRTYALDGSAPVVRGK